MKQQYLLTSSFLILLLSVHSKRKTSLIDRLRGLTLELQDNKQLMIVIEEACSDLLLGMRNNDQYLQTSAIRVLQELARISMSSKMSFLTDRALYIKRVDLLDARFYDDIDVMARSIRIECIKRIMKLRHIYTQVDDLLFLTSIEVLGLIETREPESMKRLRERIV